jgi:hypothetical protein
MTLYILANGFKDQPEQAGAEIQKLISPDESVTATITAPWPTSPLSQPCNRTAACRRAIIEA